jgi:iron(III) transport system ATP-binding protein
MRDDRGGAGGRSPPALERALAPQPAVVLLDEPFSNLDAGLREQIRAEVREILRLRQVTTIFVTHDQDEALSASDLVGVMFDGRLEQLATPEEIYRVPRTRKVAAFVGDASFLDGEASGDRVVCELGALPLARSAHGAVTVMIRPEAVRLSVVAPGQPAHGAVVQRQYYGRDPVVHVQLASGARLRARLGAQEIVQAGDHVQVNVTGSVVGLVERVAGL